MISKAEPEEGRRDHPGRPGPSRVDHAFDACNLLGIFAAQSFRHPLPALLHVLTHLKDAPGLGQAGLLLHPEDALPF